MIRTEFLLLLVAVFILFGTADKCNRVSAAEAKAKEPQSDAERLRGHWVATQVWQDGKSTDPHGACQFVFTDKEWKLPQLAFEYQVEPTQTPKRLDLNDHGTEAPAIYRFEREKLWLCIAMGSISTGQHRVRPDAFETKPGDGRILFVAERGKPTADGRPLLIAPGFKLADQILTEVLRKRVSQGAELLEKERYVEFFKEFPSPDDSGKSPKQPEKTLEEVTQIPAESKQCLAAVAKVMRATEKKVPAVNEDGTWAYFDIRDVHFNGAPPHATMFLRKVDGKWYPTDETPETPKR